MFFILNVELSIDGVVIPQVGGVYTLSDLTVYDFGKVIQIQIKNLDTIPLKDHYCLITNDSTLSSFGQRFCWLSNYNGSNKTQGKLYLLNNNILQNQTEIIQVHFEPVLGITTTNGVNLGITLSNYVINAPVFTP